MKSLTSSQAASASRPASTTGERRADRVARALQDHRARDGGGQDQDRVVAAVRVERLVHPPGAARVEWHLHKVFTRLGLRFGRDLSKALAGFDFHLVSA
jgi:hypothetical protein